MNVFNSRYKKEVERSKSKKHRYRKNEVVIKRE